jgi:hypothetical protein
MYGETEGGLIPESAMQASVINGFCMGVLKPGYAADKQQAKAFLDTRKASRTGFKNVYCQAASCHGKNRALLTASWYLAKVAPINNGFKSLKHAKFPTRQVQRHLRTDSGNL